MAEELQALPTSEQTDENDGTFQYLTFLVGEEKIAVGILDVKELIEVSSMTRVPMTPDFIRGVINLRGSVIPVIDLSARLGREVSQLSKKSCILLVEISHDEQSQAIGMLVDEVNEIVEIATEDIQPPPNFGADIRVDFIKSMGRINDEFIILLAIDRVLSVSELSAIEQFSHHQSYSKLPQQEGGLAHAAQDNSD